MECPKCHTVYFLDGGKNSDRMYYSGTASGQKRWKLLCICSEQTEFRKDEILTFETTKDALNRGHAVEGEWGKSKFDLRQMWGSAAGSHTASPLRQLLAASKKKTIP